MCILISYYDYLYLYIFCRSYKEKVWQIQKGTSDWQYLKTNSRTNDVFGENVCNSFNRQMMNIHNTQRAYSNKLQKEKLKE